MSPLPEHRDHQPNPAGLGPKLDHLAQTVDKLREDLHRYHVEFSSHRATTEAKIEAMTDTRELLSKVMESTTRIESSLQSVERVVTDVELRLDKTERRLAAVEQTHSFMAVEAAKADGKTSLIENKLVWLVAALIYLAPHLLDALGGKNTTPAPVAAPPPRVCAFTPEGKLVCVAAE